MLTSRFCQLEWRHEHEPGSQNGKFGRHESTPGRNSGGPETRSAGLISAGLCLVGTADGSQDLLDRVCNRASFAGRKRRALNPLSRTDQQLFLAVLRGEHALRGFRSRDLAQYLNQPPTRDPNQRRRQSGQRCRLLQLLRAHGLIARLPHTRRYRVTARGFAFMSAAVHLRHKAFPAHLNDVA
jgi:hypothetical protein